MRRRISEWLHARMQVKLICKSVSQIDRLLEHRQRGSTSSSSLSTMTMQLLTGLV